jgi:hypothetical protein
MMAAKRSRKATEMTRRPRARRARAPDHRRTLDLVGKVPLAFCQPISRATVACNPVPATARIKNADMSAASDP